VKNTGTKSKAALNKEESSNHQAALTAYFSWEFLRRSPKYRRDYQRFVKQFPTYPTSQGGSPDWLLQESRKRDEDPGSQSKTAFMPRFMDASKAFHAVWGISPTAPDARFSPFFSHRTYWVNAHKLIERPSVLTLEIDLTGPLPEIFRQVEWFINSNYPAQTPQKSNATALISIPSTFRRTTCIKAGKSDSDIATILNQILGFRTFPNLSNAYSSTAIKPRH